MKRSPLAVLFLTVFVDLLGFGIVLPLLPQYAKDYDASGQTLGLLMASFSIMQLLFAPFWGRLSDRHGRRPILMVGLAGSVLSYTLFAFAEMDGFPQALGFDDPLPVLFISRIAAGLFGATISTAYAYIADVTDEKTRGKGMALIGAAFGIGFTVGPSVGGLADQYVDKMAPGLIAAVLSLVALVLAWRVLEEPERRGKAARKGLMAFRALGRALRAPTVMWVIALQFLATVAFANLEGTLALFARGKFDYDTGNNGWLFSYLGFCLLLAQGVIVRRLLPRIGELQFNVAGSVFLGLGMAGVAVSTAEWHAWVALAVGVLGFAIMTTSLTSLLSRRTPRDMQGEILGLNQSSLSMARILGPYAGNVLLAEALALPFWTGAGLMAAAFLASLWLLRAPAPSR